MKAYSNRMKVIVNGGSFHILDRRKLDLYGLRKYTRVLRLLSKYKQRRKTHAQVLEETHRQSIFG